MFNETVVDDLLEMTKRLNEECSQRTSFEGKLMEIIREQDKIIKEKEAQILALEEGRTKVDTVKNNCLSKKGMVVPSGNTTVTENIQ